MLTSTNLEKHTISAKETPRTKVIRYFTQVEDPTSLRNRDTSPIVTSQFNDPWHSANRYLQMNLAKTNGQLPEPFDSLILGQNHFQPFDGFGDENKKSIRRAFRSDDSEILMPNWNSQNIVNVISPRKLHSSTKVQEEKAESAYTWSESLNGEEDKENIYEKRPRRKMVKDPVTGTLNKNPKKAKPKQKTSKKVSRPSIFNELRPLDNFESKLLGKNRLSLDTNLPKGRSGAKDLQFPKLSELGIKSSQRAKRDLEVVSEAVPDDTNKGDRQIQVVGKELPISDYFERATKQVDDAVLGTSPQHKHATDPETSNPEAKPSRTDGEVEETLDSNSPKQVEQNLAESTPDQQAPTNKEDERGRSQGDTGQSGKRDCKNLDLLTLVQTSGDTTTLSERLQSNVISNHANDPSSTEESYPSMLQNYTHIPPPDQSPPEPPSTTLDTLLEACSILLPTKPFPLPLPLQHKAETVQKPHLWNTKTVAQEILIPTLTEPSSSSIWMYPVNEDGVVRYVSGPPVKKRRIWKPRYRPKPVQYEKVFEEHLYGDLDPMASIAPSFYFNDEAGLPGEQSFVDRGDLSADSMAATDSGTAYFSNNTVYQPNDAVLQELQESYQDELSREMLLSDELDEDSDTLSDVVLFENRALQEEEVAESIPTNRFNVGEGHSAFETYGVSSEIPFDDNWWKDRRRRM